MFCRECGSEVPKKTKACPNCQSKPLHGSKHCQACGANTKPDQESCKKCGVQLIKHGPAVKEDAPPLAKVASLCMPVVGLILFLVWRNNKPQAASTVCSWTIIGVAVGMILYVLGLVSGVFSAVLGI